MSESPSVADNASWLEDVAFNDEGLVPAIAQDHGSGEVLMMAWMNRESLELTAREGIAVYYSRSRGALWRKGETSGHTQKVHEIRMDCDSDVILLQVEQLGGIACHTGRRRCFYRRLGLDGWQTTDEVVRDPQAIYGKDTT